MSSDALMAHKQITFSFCPNVCSDCECSRKSAGRLFHILAPATAKFLVPNAVFAPVTTRQPD